MSTKNKFTSVHRVPAEETTSVLELKDGTFEFNPFFKQNKEDIYHHLYFTVDEEIKKGDWVLSKVDDESYNDIYQYDGTTTLLDEDYKIIKTTNRKLGLPSISSSFLQKYCSRNGSLGEVVEKLTTPRAFLEQREADMIKAVGYEDWLEQKVYFVSEIEEMLKEYGETIKKEELL